MADPAASTDLLWGASYGASRHIVDPATVVVAWSGGHRSGVGICGQPVDSFSDDTSPNPYDWAPSLRRNRTWSETVMRRKPCKRCEKKTAPVR